MAERQQDASVRATPDDVGLGRGPRSPSRSNAGCRSRPSCAGRRGRGYLADGRTVRCFIGSKHGIAVPRGALDGLGLDLSLTPYTLRHRARSSANLRQHAAASHCLHARYVRDGNRADLWPLSERRRGRRAQGAARRRGLAGGQRSPVGAIKAAEPGRLPRHRPGLTPTMDGSHGQGCARS